METIKIANHGVKMIAHRGLSGLERENTMVAFIAAFNRSYYGTECDIHLTKDQHFIICHDDNTGRVANQQLIIKERTMEELQDIRLNDIHSHNPKSYLLMPSLIEYLESSKRYDKHCIVEIKCELSNIQVEQLLYETEEYHDIITFISFSIENLKRIRNFNEKIPLQFLTTEFSDALIEQLVKYYLDVDMHYKQLTAERIEAFHNANILVNAWTVDNPTDALMLIAWGVDYITTNILE